MPTKKEREDYIRVTVRDVPSNPSASLLSRRRSDYPDPENQMRCDCIAFPLVRSVLITEIREAQKKLERIIQSDMIRSSEGRLSFPIIWPSDKTEHRAMKPYKIQANPHLSFSGSVKPYTIEEYLETKITQRFIPRKIPVYVEGSGDSARFEECDPLIPRKFIEKREEKGMPSVIERPSDSLTRAFEILERYAKTQPRGKVKECKLNPDGHIVVRVDIEPPENLLACRNALSEAFGGTYVRYTDPEKQKTLATVIAVVDYNRLSEEARKQLEGTIATLDTHLKSLGSFPLPEIAWLEFENRRTLSPNSINRQRFFFSTPPDKDSPPSGIMSCRV